MMYELVCNMHDMLTPLGEYAYLCNVYIVAMHTTNTSSAFAFLTQHQEFL
jgi:hypothetical protein